MKNNRALLWVTYWVLCLSGGMLPRALGTDLDWKVIVIEMLWLNIGLLLGFIWWKSAEPSVEEGK